MNKIRITFLALLAQLSVSTPVVATDAVTPTSYTAECHSNGCGDACAMNEDMWTKVREEINYCECSTCSTTTRCSYVGPANTWVLKEETAKKQYTLYAGARITGIECSHIWTTNDPDYWVSAWNEAIRHLPSEYHDKIGLAINSKNARDRTQLHIHVTCISQKAYGDLDENKMATKPQEWANHELLMPNNYKYHALFLEQAKTPVYTDLTRDHNLFEVLHQYVVKKDSEMANQSLIVVRGKKGGFYILNLADTSSAKVPVDDLLDKTCSWGPQPH